MTGRFADHRVEAAVNLQTWRSLTFLHWPMEQAAVQERLPPGLQVDTHDGAAWIGVTPFLMRNVRPPGVPAVPHLSDFPEVNLRTYVRGPRDKTGIWFFSLDCPRLPAIAALRIFGLPYFWAKMRVSEATDGIAYRSRRRTGPAGMHATVRIGAHLPEPDLLTNFLTGRWAAYTQRGEVLWRVPIEHEPWPLYEARAQADVGALVRAAGLPMPVGEPMAHFSPAVHTRIGPPRPA